MPASLSIQAAHRSSALQLLLTRYMHGQIADGAWGQLMLVFDADDVTSQERLALANFINDVLKGDAAAGNLLVPKVEEAQALLTETRFSEDTPNT